MAVSLTTDVADESTETLTVVESVKVGSKRLAVAKDGSGRLHLCRERERGTLKDGKRSREHGTERFWKRTSDLADVRDALASNLIAA